MFTTQRIVGFARWLEEIEPGFLVTVISAETGADYRERDLLDRVAKLIEIFEVVGAATIGGCR